MSTMVRRIGIAAAALFGVSNASLCIDEQALDYIVLEARSHILKDPLRNQKNAPKAPKTKGSILDPENKAMYDQFRKYKGVIQDKSVCSSLDAGPYCPLVASGLAPASINLTEAPPIEADGVVFNSDFNFIF